MDQCLLRLFREYFSGRIVTDNDEMGRHSEGVVSVLSQESKIGLLGWNLVFNRFLGLPEQENARVIAYGDDASLLIGGNPRRKLEETAAMCDSPITDWGTRQEM